ncbi:MAG: response regulator [Phycisphaera sp.]|nr:response regulator [Phycisphaera sp.]
MSETPERVLRLLLVEDDDAHAQIVRLALEGAETPSDVMRVADGEEAIRFLRGEEPFTDRRRPDLVLLDLRLPKIDGHEVLRTIKNDDGLRSIPVVVLSTSDADTDLSRAYGNHVNSYMVKPADFIEFREMIRDLIAYWGRWNLAPARNGGS